MCVHDYNYSFEAVANCPVDFDLLGPDAYHSDRTENQAPYFVFEDDGNGTIGPASLGFGVYILRAFPHGERDHAAMVKFLVMDC